MSIMNMSQYNKSLKKYNKASAVLMVETGKLFGRAHNYHLRRAVLLEAALNRLGAEIDRWEQYL